MAARIGFDERRGPPLPQEGRPTALRIERAGRRWTGHVTDRHGDLLGALCPAGRFSASRSAANDTPTFPGFCRACDRAVP